MMYREKQVIVKIIEICVNVYNKERSNICAQLFGVHFKGITLVLHVKRTILFNFFSFRIRLHAGRKIRTEKTCDKKFNLSQINRSDFCAYSVTVYKYIISCAIKKSRSFPSLTITLSLSIFVIGPRSDSSIGTISDMYCIISRASKRISLRRNCNNEHFANKTPISRYFNMYVKLIF